MDDNAANQRVDAPPGARCAVHVEAPATVVCTRCGNYCCYACGVQYNAAYLCTSCFEREREGAHYGDASKSQRFVNLVIDQIAIRVLVVIAVVVMTLLGLPAWLYYVTLIPISVGYYVAFEHYGGRTLGKLVTRTKVVATDGGAPSLGQLVGRSFARYIPFEPFSIFLEDGTWHDGLSRTRVVRTTPPKWLSER